MDPQVRDELKRKLEQGALEFRVPELVLEGIICYVCHGLRPGSFLSAVLSNDLRQAVARADTDSRRLLANIVSLLDSFAPMGCWGSPREVEDWLGHFTERADLNA